MYMYVSAHVYYYVSLSCNMPMSACHLTCVGKVGQGLYMYTRLGGRREGGGEADAQQRQRETHKERDRERERETDRERESEQERV